MNSTAKQILEKITLTLIMIEENVIDLCVKNLSKEEIETKEYSDSDYLKADNWILGDCAIPDRFGSLTPEEERQNLLSARMYLLTIRMNIEEMQKEKGKVSEYFLFGQQQATIISNHSSLKELDKETQTVLLNGVEEKVFNTQEELDAYRQGLGDGEGWFEAGMLEDFCHTGITKEDIITLKNKNNGTQKEQMS